MRRVFIGLAALSAAALPITVTAVTISATPAGAATPVACKKLSGSDTGSFTVKKCTPKNKADKSASGTSSSLATGGGTITWSPSGGTTTVSISFTASGSSCPKASEYVISGTVTGGTSTYTASGQTVSAEVCVASSGKLSLVKGTSMDL
jgi:hypothetical protein